MLQLDTNPMRWILSQEHEEINTRHVSCQPCPAASVSRRCSEGEHATGAEGGCGGFAYACGAVSMKLETFRTEGAYVLYLANMDLSIASKVSIASLKSWIKLSHRFMLKSSRMTMRIICSFSL